MNNQTTCNFCEDNSVASIGETQLCEIHLTVFLCHFPECSIVIDSQWPGECYYCNNQAIGLDPRGRALCSVCYDVADTMKSSARRKQPVVFHEGYDGSLRETIDGMNFPQPY